MQNQLFSRVKNALEWRWQFINDSTALESTERLRVLLPVGKRHTLTDMLRQRIQIKPDGSTFIDIGSHRVYLSTGSADSTPPPETMIEGFLTILHEAYCPGPDFLRGQVQLSVGDVVFDVGANVGTSALYFSDIVGAEGQVYSFEPVHQEALLHTVTVNKKTNVEVLAYAISEQAGFATFALSDKGIDARISEFASGQKAVNIRQTAHEVTVPVITIDQFVEEREIDRIDLIKLDIEGTEEYALRGAVKTLERLRPNLSIASYHTDPLGDPQHHKLVALLKTLSYEIEEVGTRHIYAW